ncbi:ubiquitin thioesterase OTUB2 [Ambystoma mexicanum]|uniref:ubiquitin thioesterase OTUB2 n=1 Tax=Ambystoma mexicanum TaxID=8296 RepID=UPI0037E81399
MSDLAFDLISEKFDFLSILNDHPGNRIYQRKIQDLSQRYASIRKTKGDGNCFYRALGFSYLETLIGNDRAEINRFKDIVLKSKNELTAAGLEDHEFGNLFKHFFSVIKLVENGGSVSSLLHAFNDERRSDSIVQYLRLLTAAFLKNRAEFFQHFVDDGMDIKDFCAQEVEPMAMECDHLQITALSQALAVRLQVEYVDDTDTAVNHHKFPEHTSPSVYMLFTRQHYNILYSAS